MRGFHAGCVKNKQAGIGGQGKGAFSRGFSLKIGMVRIMLLKKHDVRVCNK
jgi:hypothetical protein